MPDKKKVVLWDNDGVLVDTEGLFFDATRNILSKVNIELTLDMYIDYSLNYGKNMFNLAKEMGFNNHEIETLRNERDNIYSKYIATRNIVLQDIEMLLHKLKGYVRMGVVTTSQKAHFDIIHKNTNLLKYFDFIVTREDYLNSKPAPDPYLLAIGLSRCKAEDCVAVEDSVRGLKSARAANIDCIIIKNNLTKNMDFSGSLEITDNVKELSDCLLKMI